MQLPIQQLNNVAAQFNTLLYVSLVNFLAITVFVCFVCTIIVIYEPFKITYIYCLSNFVFTMCRCHNDVIIIVVYFQCK